MTREGMLRYLGGYPRPVRVMEVCGTHTRAIAQAGLRSLPSPQIRLLSGPGCPVRVTSAGFIGALWALAVGGETRVLTFGDLMRVPGTEGDLSDARAAGGQVRAVPSLLYAVLLEAAEREGVRNLRLMTALRTMPPALDFLCRGAEIDAFLCPGHVSAVTGWRAYEPLAARHRRPFVVAGSIRTRS